MSFAVATWEALGSTAQVVVTDADALAPAARAVETELLAIDRTCSRFRDDAELSGVHAAAGAVVPVSERLAEAVAVALDAARRTDGLVDPTVGAAVIAAGYDRDFDDLPLDAPALSAVPAPGWRRVRLDRARRTLQLPVGVRLDLGATAKALAADRAAAAAQAVAGGHGVLISLGGDVAVAGPVPDGGWPVGLADGHRDAPATTVSIAAGGLATSSTTQRRWRRGGTAAHHILDPRTGAPAPVVWRTVSVAAVSCVRANIASTAAIILGESAPAWLTDHGLPARLVRADGETVGTCGWIPEPVAA
ncbi:FAD:protein FMN transferase [Baekduia soli]|uniref:FAD:protein FMN transferase n=1 Tax=Baekduia soli TaxID=496014 RepID=A0A5B8UB45_9ACTN|nr:FAD:protein FMN transferase [Baekduia soli]QEC50376.1 FAD:protein FMN transferase [Baekduia soli]